MEQKIIQTEGMVFKMKRFNVTVNGVSYDVVVEEIAADSAPVVQSAPAAPKAAPAAPKAAPAPAGKSGATSVKAPMPGTILKVNVSAGDSVKKGDVLCVLEAMKMENDICAPADGVVATVNAQKGASVNTDDVLVTLD
jgi:biotin carboxyl carrier protein